VVAEAAKAAAKAAAKTAVPARNRPNVGVNEPVRLVRSVVSRVVFK